MGLPEQDDTPLLPQFWSSCVGGKTEGPILGPVDLRFSLSPYPDLECERTFGSPGHPGCGRRAECSRSQISLL